MITLITGTPGAGKTAWTVQELTRLPSQRKVYVHGIPDLKIAHEPIYCTSNLCEHCQSLTQIHYNDKGEGEYLELLDKPGEPLPLVENWPDWATDGSLIVIDEVQRIWRPSASGKLPEEIAALETHRHHGLDFWLISQGPHLFHSNVRLLIGKHIHLVSMWNGRKEYEWPECRQNVTSRGDAVVRPYTLPKKVFHLYKSSSLHVKQTHRKPLAFYGFFVSVFFLAIACYFGYQRVMSHMQDDQAGTDGPAHAAPAAGAGAAVPAKTDSIIKPPAGTGSFPDFTPQIEGVPESAPAYAGLNKVQDVPHLMGCVKTPDWCRCYTTQGTPYPVSVPFCESYLRGEYFNPWKERKAKEPPEPELITAKNP
jgi:zona occludens toxin